MRKFLFFTLLFLTAVLPGAEIPVLEWVNPGKGGRFFERDGVRCYTLTVSETEKAGQHLASAAIDLTPWKNRPMVFSIRVSGENVSEPPQEWNGVKFMIYYKTADGRVHWRGTNRQRGTFGVCTVSNLLTIPEDAVDGRVMVGLQESSGTVTFELDSFMVAPLFDADCIVNMTEGYYPKENAGTFLEKAMSTKCGKEIFRKLFLEAKQ